MEFKMEYYGNNDWRDYLRRQNELMHFGIPKKSGRFKWGFGKNPFHHGKDAPTSAGGAPKDPKEIGGGFAAGYRVGEMEEELQKKMEQLRRKALEKQADYNRLGKELGNPFGKAVSDKSNKNKSMEDLVKLQIERNFHLKANKEKAREQAKASNQNKRMAREDAYANRTALSETRAQESARRQQVEDSTRKKKQNNKEDVLDPRKKRKR